MEKGNKRWLISFYHLEIKTLTGVVITLGRWWRCSVTPLQPARSSHPARSPPPCRERIFFSENSPCWVWEERFCWNATSNGRCNMYPRVSWCHNFSAVSEHDVKHNHSLWTLQCSLRFKGFQEQDSLGCRTPSCWCNTAAPPASEHMLSINTNSQAGYQAPDFSAQIYMTKSSSLFLFSSEDASLLAEKQKIPRLFLCWLFPRFLGPQGKWTPESSSHQGCKADTPVSEEHNNPSVLHTHHTVGTPGTGFLGTAVDKCWQMSQTTPFCTDIGS